MREYDVIIVGAGVSGTSLAKELATNSNVGSIAILEKYSGVALVNSHPLNNAQTGHKGDKETNYTVSQAVQLRDKAEPLYQYVQKRNVPGLFKKMQSMVLGVGKKECEMLRDRHKMLTPHFPRLELIGPNRIAELEPKVMEGRDPFQRVCALYSDDALAINYQKLAECFLEDAQKANSTLSTFFNTSVERIQKAGPQTILTTSEGSMMARVAVFAAGAYSLHFAHQLGIARDLSIQSFGGNFRDGGHLLKGKVYRPQEEGIPLAADHGDPDVLDTQRTRFGPTVNPIFMMERRKYDTILDYFRFPVFRSIPGMWRLFRLLLNPTFFRYIVRNQMYEMPLIGNWLYARVIRQIVPTIRARDLIKRKGAGGSRPQVFNSHTGKLEMGDKTLISQGCIFNTTPSPGASVCLANAQRDAAMVVELLNNQLLVPRYHYDLTKSRRDLIRVA